MLSLEDVKNELDITFDDPRNDRKISAILRRAESKVRKYVGINEETELNLEEEALIINYCRYEYNSALEMFEKNFQCEINEARSVREVEAAFAEESEGEDGA